MLLITAMFAFLGCRSDMSASALADRTIQYQIEGNRYAVVVAEDGISEGQAKEEAVKRAAQVAVDNGYRYFVVDSESEVSMMKSNQGFPSPGSRPTNLYYELIQSGNFGREPIDQPQPSMENLYSGWRIQFSCYKERPSRKAIDACQYASCDK